MNKIILAAALFCTIPITSSCATFSSSPAEIANSTKIDEQSVNTLELAYKAWRLAAETGVKAGYIKGSSANSVAALDNRLYATLTAAEQAYSGSNASDYATALANFNAALADGYTAIGGK